MNIHKMKLSAFTLAFILFIPSTSQAYFATGQTATRINDDTVLYTVSYRLGFLGRDLYAPIVAVRDSESSTSSTQASFSLMDEGNKVSTAGVINALILTGDEDAVIKDGQYFVPDKKSAEFTLVALLTIQKEQQTGALSLQVTDLPFTLIKDDEVIPSELNDTELQDYKTPAISFGEGVIISSPRYILSTEK